MAEHTDTLSPPGVVQEGPDGPDREDSTPRLRVLRCPHVRYGDAWGADLLRLVVLDLSVLQGRVGMDMDTERANKIADLSHTIADLVDFPLL